MIVNWGIQLSFLVEYYFKNKKGIFGIQICYIWKWKFLKISISDFYNLLYRNSQQYFSCSRIYRDFNFKTSSWKINANIEYFKIFINIRKYENILHWKLDRLGQYQKSKRFHEINVQIFFSIFFFQCIWDSKNYNYSRKLRWYFGKIL
jgi:hypothetical protein